MGRQIESSVAGNGPDTRNNNPFQERPVSSAVNGRALPLVTQDRPIHPDARRAAEAIVPPAERRRILEGQTPVRDDRLVTLAWALEQESLVERGETSRTPGLAKTVTDVIVSFDKEQK